MTILCLAIIELIKVVYVIISAVVLYGLVSKLAEIIRRKNGRR